MMVSMAWKAIRFLRLRITNQLHFKGFSGKIYFKWKSLGQIAMSGDMGRSAKDRRWKNGLNFSIIFHMESSLSNPDLRNAT